MSVVDEPIKEIWNSMSPGLRHAISLLVIGGLIVVLFMFGIRDPQARAADAIRDHDKRIADNRRDIDAVKETERQVAQTQALMQQSLEALLQAQRDDHQTVKRIEEKVDRVLLRGR